MMLSIGKKKIKKKIKKGCLKRKMCCMFAAAKTGSSLLGESSFRVWF